MSLFCCFASKIPNVKPSDATAHSKLPEPEPVAKQPVSTDALETELETKVVDNEVTENEVAANEVAENKVAANDDARRILEELANLRDEVAQMRCSLAETNIKHATEVEEFRAEILQLNQEHTETVAAALDKCQCETPQDEDDEGDSQARSGAESAFPNDATCADGDRREVEGGIGSNQLVSRSDSVDTAFLELKQHVQDEFKLFKEHSDQQIAGSFALCAGPMLT
jgi:hypothetical protein